MANNTRITSGFWRERLETNATVAIFHQWQQLEASGCIENFRLAAGEAKGIREGWFFADSDAYKWLDAAARIYRHAPDTRLGGLMDAFIALLANAQSLDGYLFTYNQIHFPGTRWVNLQIEHELYCHGHLIEAGIAHHEATGRTDMLSIARRAADCVVADFMGRGPAYTPGHEEIEIALLRLYQVTGHITYLELARQFVTRRGRTPLFALSLLRQGASAAERERHVRQKKQAYLSAHPEFKPYQLPPGNRAKKPWNALLRWGIGALTGKFFQQHAPVHRQTVPVGHSVRFAYLESAIAMLARAYNEHHLIPTLERAWERMVTRRMYVTGGIGSLPGLEGFGNDYELDPEYAYTETCAALASLFWNWEMAQITGEAKYSDLYERQLYNATAVGMGLDGISYFFNNPLTSLGEISRQPWYAVPCCPSNLSRSWADLGKCIYSCGENDLRIHQYISSEASCELARVEMLSELPWDGKVRIRLKLPAPAEFSLYLRIPAWSQQVAIKINHEPLPYSPCRPAFEPTACGYDPRLSTWLPIRRTWSDGDVVTLSLDMSIQLQRMHARVKGQAGKVALSRGPLVYCLESIDNPNVDIFAVKIDPASFEPVFEADLLGGAVVLRGKTKNGIPLTFIPYMLWGNRGPSQMNVFVKIKS